MQKCIRFLIYYFLITSLIGCGKSNQVENIGVFEFRTSTSEQYVTEQIPIEEHPVMSEESITNIVEAFDMDEKDRYGQSVANYLYASHLPVSAIVKAEIVGRKEDFGEYSIEVTDSENRKYVVVLTKSGSLVGIKENSKEGKWVFVVTE